jgi:hypothetical protein
MQNKKKIILLVITLIVFSFIGLYFYYFYFNNSDIEFVNLIKDMAIKNHNNPNLYTEKYNSAITDEEKLKIVLTNNFYNCVYSNNTNITTKLDINLYCGHFIKF